MSGQKTGRTLPLRIIVSGLAVIAFVIREWTHASPIMDLQLLRKRNFATALLFSFILGVTMNGSTILIRQFLQNVLGYPAQRAGLVLMPGGFALMVMMPIAAIMGARFDRRLMITLGYSLAALGLYQLTSITLGATFSQMQMLRVVHLIGTPFSFVNITTMN